MKKKPTSPATTVQIQTQPIPLPVQEKLKSIQERANLSVPNTGVRVTVVTEHGSEAAHLFPGPEVGFTIDSGGFLKVWRKYTNNLIAAFHPSSWRSASYEK